MRSRRSGSCTWGGEVTALLLPCDGSWVLGQARNPFRAGARVTFFLKRKSPKKTLGARAHLPPERWPAFFDEASCLVEKRRTSCASPAGCPIDTWRAIADAASKRSAHKHTAMPPWPRPVDVAASLEGRGIHGGASRRERLRAGFHSMPGADRVDGRSAAIDGNAVGDPKGDAQDARRFSMRHGGLIEKSRPLPRWQMCPGPDMFSLVTFFAPKKVTRAPARKTFRAFPKAQPRSHTPTERPT